MPEDLSPSSNNTKAKPREAPGLRHPKEDDETYSPVWTGVTSSMNQNQTGPLGRNLHEKAQESRLNKRAPK